MRYLMLVFLLAGCTAQSSDPAPSLWSETRTDAVRAQLHDPDPAKRAAAQRELRQHGWELLRIVMANARRPTWYWDWCTLDGVYRAGPCPKPGERVENLKAQTGTDALPSIDSVLSSSYYNPAMAAYLRQSLENAVSPPAPALAAYRIAGPSPAGTMKALAQAYQKVQGDKWVGKIPEVPHDAIIVKPGWYRLPCPTPGSNPSVGVYKGLQDDGWKPQSTVNRVKVRPKTLNYKSYCQVPQEMMNQSEDGMMNLNDFMYFRSQEGNDFEVEGLPNGQINKGDYLLLVGLHVVTHEQKDWVWTTFWWSPTAVEAGDAPAWVKNNEKLRHFNMRITLEMGTDPDKDAVFNPYLEASSKGGTKAHCIACHRNAKVIVNGAGTPNAALDLKIPGMADWSQTPDCAGSVCTNFVWSVARRAYLLRFQ